MGYYNNIFASIYNFYAKFKNETPLITTVCIVAVCQWNLVLLAAAIVKRIYQIDLSSFHSSYKYYSIPIIALWIYFLYKYYSKNRIELLKKFEEKKISEKKKWRVISIISFIMPLIFIAILLTK